MEDERSLSIHAMSLAACRPDDVYRRPRICYRPHRDGWCTRRPSADWRRALDVRSLSLHRMLA